MTGLRSGLLRREISIYAGMTYSQICHPRPDKVGINSSGNTNFNKPMLIKEIKNQSTWDNFFNQNGSPSFLHSWEWGEFQKSLGESIWRLGIYEGNELLAIALVIKISAKRGRFFFIPHGPIFSKKIVNNHQRIKNILNLLINTLKEQAKKENFSFIRIAPILTKNEKNKKIFQSLGFRIAPIYMHAETIWQLALNLSEEKLLSQMRKTTRYLIRKAQKENVIIEKRTDKQAVEDFYQVYQETFRREKFTPFSKEFIRKEFEAFDKTGRGIFLFAKINNKAKMPVSNDLGGSQSRLVEASTPTGVRNTASSEHLASALIVFTSSTAFYHQGASIHTQIPATYSLQWEAIKEAKKRGCQYYNFWGIYDEDSKRTLKSWQGLTLFKTGFGGEKISYLETMDYPLSFKYWLTFFWEKLLFLKRNFNQ